MCLWQWRKRGGVEEETALFPQRRKRGAQEKRCAFQPVARTAATDGACKARPAAGQKLIINRGKKNTTRSRSAKARRATISSRCFLMLLGQLSLIPAEPPPPTASRPLVSICRGVRCRGDRLFCFPRLSQWMRELWQIVRRRSWRKLPQISLSSYWDGWMWAGFIFMRFLSLYLQALQRAN